MKRVSAKSLLLAVIVVPAGGVVLFVLVALVWPTEPLPLSEVFENSCGLPLPDRYTVGKREHSYSMAIQGVWYHEETELAISPADTTSAQKALRASNLFTEKAGYFERFEAGEIMATCSLNPVSGEIRLSYVLW